MTFIFFIKPGLYTGFFYKYNATLLFQALSEVESSLMKKLVFTLSFLPLLFAACSKESKCIKGKIIDINPCSKTWGVQILDGPSIGTQYGPYDNVIELYDVPFDAKSRDAIIYFTYGKKKSQPERPCIAIMPMPDFSSVEKSLVSLGETECP